MSPKANVERGSGPRNERRSPTTRPGRGGDAAPRPSRAATVLASAVGFVVAAAGAGALAWGSGCGSEPPPGASSDEPPRSSYLPPPTATTRASAPVPSTSATTADAGAEPRDGGAQAPEQPYNGPLLGALAMQTPVYPTPDFSKDRIGYIRLGGKVPVDPTPIKNDKCSKGWYHLVDGGYVCGKYATLDVNSPQVRLGVTVPNVDDILPYKYAYNTAHGTPLYRSMPARDEMMRYEPYLGEKKKKKKHDGEGGADEGEDESAKKKTEPSRTDQDVAASIGTPDGGAPEPDDDPNATQKPWWQRPTEPGKKLDVTLADLEKEADGTVAKRMVKGFFVAVDKTFSYSDRLWYKTTSGLIAPSDRMYINKPPSSHGIDVPAGVTQVGFSLVAKALKFDYDADKKTVKPAGSIPRQTAFLLTGATVEHKGALYRQTAEGWWAKASDGTITEPGPPPKDLAPGEKWIDVNLTTQSLVAFVGDKPVYATLVSTGKVDKVNKEKNHETPKGSFRIREKHVAATMDGDVASDGPYSIEDVPWIMYFNGSYALHGAFWHSNFGHTQSHGCVNLSPDDARALFAWTEPHLPEGWHGVWATDEHPGTRVIVHD